MKDDNITCLNSLVWCVSIASLMALVIVESLTDATVANTDNRENH